MLKINLDLSALRSFVAAVDLGGFGKAARHLHRTPGAISLQLKALEDRLAQALFVREAKRQRLTPAGEVLLAHARRLLEANDDAVLALRSNQTEGDVRLGMPPDLADTWLPPVLAQLTRSYPRVRIHLRVGTSSELRSALAAAELDLVLAFGNHEANNSQQIACLDVRWWGTPPPEPTALPVLALEGPCLFRDAAVRALDQSAKPWRLAMSSSSVSALWAAAIAGLGVTARAALNVPATLREADAIWQLPPLPPVGLFLHTLTSAPHPIVDYLSERVRADFA